MRGGRRRAGPAATRNTVRRCLCAADAVRYRARRPPLGKLAGHEAYVAESVAAVPPVKAGQHAAKG